MLTRYHCPYCDAWIDHKPEWSGDRVACSKCHGEYFEPTDLVPGVRPEKAPPLEPTPSPVAPATPQLDPAPSPTDIAAQLHQLQPFDMVMEMKRRGSQAIMITQSPASPTEAGVVFSDNLTADQVNDTILKLAVRIMETKWPDVYQLVANRA